MNRFIFALLLLATPLTAQSIFEEPLPTIMESPLDGVLQMPSFEFDGERSANSDVGTGAILRGLDRITGVVGDFAMDIGETLEFERLEVTLEACRYPPNDVNKDAFALLKIRDIREEDDAFYGWMFASSPALSALDHPRYDIWVIACQIEAVSTN
ncbi:MAG: DUF2155 domain-containing protein [Rhodobacteraceae bacterium]|nr:DUF2155 domain-containing protein [Paracoccaceae bacterium]